MAFDPSSAKPEGFDPATANPEEERGTLGEIGAGVARGLYQGAAGLGASMQAPAEQAGAEPGIVSKAGKALEEFGQAGIKRNPAQTESHGPVTNTISEAAEAAGGALPAIGAFSLGSLNPTGPVGGAAAGAAQAGEQAWHERYQAALAAGKSDADARDYANSSATIAAAAMGGLPVAGKALGVAGRVGARMAGFGAKDAAEAAADIVGKKFLPELGKSAAEMTGANVVAGAAGAAGQASVDQQAGLGTQTPGEAAVASIPGSVVASIGFVPFSVLHAAGNVKAAAQKARILADPKAPADARDAVVREVYDAMQKADPAGANMWAINAAEAKAKGLPIGVDQSWTTGLHPSVSNEVPRLPAPPKALPAPGQTTSEADRAAAARDAQRAAYEAEQARLRASGTLGNAAAIANDSGAAAHADATRRQDIAPGEPVQLASAGPGDDQALLNLQSLARGAQPIPLQDAQAAASSASPESPLTVVPHPSGSGFAVLPSRFLTPNLTEQLAGLQRGSTLTAPESVLIGHEGFGGGYTREQTPEERASPFPFATAEAARNHADAVTMRTGVEQDVVPHPYQHDRFAVQPRASEEVRDHATNAPEAFNDAMMAETHKETNDAVQEPSAGEVLQREPLEVGEAGGERGRVQPSIEGLEPTEARAEGGRVEEGDEARVHESVGRLLKAPGAEAVDRWDAKPIEPDSPEHLGLARTFREAGIDPEKYDGVPFHTFDWTEENDSLPARYYPDGSIGIRSDVLRAVSRGHPVTEASVEWLNHESSHAIDSDGNGGFASDSAPSFEISGEADERKPVGGIISEAHEAWLKTSDDWLKKFLSYPMDMMEDRAEDRDMSSEAKLTRTIKNETFAQLNTLYKLRPDLMKAELPKAYELFKRINDDNRAGIAATRRAVHATLRAAGADGSLPDTVRGEGAQDQGSAGVRHARARVEKRPLDEHDRTLAAATFADFGRGRVGEILKRRNWAVLTAENPDNVTRGGTPEGDAANAAANAKLKKDLDRLGLPYKETTGKYGGPLEHGFLVTKIDPEIAHKLRKKYKQESILTNRGLEYGDKTVQPAIDVTEHASNPGDYYTTVPGGATFTVNMDWDAPRIPKTLPLEYVKDLTPEEIGLLSEGNGRAERFVDMVHALPDKKFYVAAAQGGEAARKWYEDSRKAIQEVYGSDSTRFLALLAALSPQTSVKGNFFNAARVFAAWDESGRTKDKEKLAKIFRDNLVTDQGREDGKNAMDAWTINGARTLVADDPMSIRISGPKVSSFMMNLLGHTAEVTNDRHMLAFAGLTEKTNLAYRLKGKELADKAPAYMALSVRVRQAARELGWEPSETQAAVWSWWNSLKRLSNETGRSALDLLNDGSLTRERIAAEPHLGSYLHAEEYGTIDRARFERAGRLAGQAGNEDRVQGAGEGSRPDQAATRENAQRLDELLGRGRGDAYEGDDPVYARAREALGHLDEDDDGVRFARTKSGDIDTRTDRFKRWFGNSKAVDAAGKPTRLYHGTLSDFSAFDRGANAVESFFGPGIYMSDSIHDVNKNYATASGPDQISKVEKVMEQLADEGVRVESYAEAAEHLDNRGAVMPLYAKIENPLVFGGDDHTRFTYHLMQNADGDIVGEEGTLPEFLRVLDEVMQGELEPGFVDEVNEIALDNGHISANQLLELARDHDLHSFDDEGRSMFGGRLMADAAERMGFDGIIDHLVQRRFPFMMDRAWGPVSHYIAFEPTQVKSAIGNRGTYSSTDPDVRHARVAPFYSALERGIEDKAPFSKDGKIAAGMLANWADARTKDGLIKRDELEWTGFTDWLRTKDAKQVVTRDEVREFLDSHGVKLTEYTYGGNGSDRSAEIERQERILHHLQVTRAQMGGDQPAVDALNNVMRETLAKISDLKGEQVSGGLNRERISDGAASYAPYVLPGGKNYREVLLTVGYKLPDGWAVKKEEFGPYAWQVFDEQGDQAGLGYSREDAIADAMTGTLSRQQFHSQHFDPLNIVAHMRVTDRTDVDGKKTLFAEELQSDWAQMGRSDGFKTAEKERERRLMLLEAERLHEKADSVGGATGVELRSQAIALEKKAAHQFVVAGPFVQKTEAWTALVLKRLAMYAAQHDYDRVAWTTGKQQADRYNLSKHVKEILYDTTNARLRVFDTNGGKVLDQRVERNDLADHIGKEAADRIVNDPTTKRGDYNVLEGNGLVMGGEGMKSFYDNIVPNVANDVLKKIGGGRVNSSDMMMPSGDAYYGEELVASNVTREYFENLWGDGYRYVERKYNATQQGFDITPQMREKVAGGLPLFARDTGRRASARELMGKIFGGGKPKAEAAEQQFTKGGEPVREVDHGEPDWVKNASPETSSFLRKAGVYVPKKTWRERWAELKQNAGLKIIQAAVDQYAPVLKYLGKYPYQLLRMASSSDNGLSVMIDHGQIDMNKYGALKVRPGTAGLREVMAPLHGEHDRMLAWMAAQRAQELMREGREHNFTPEEIAAGLKLNQQLGADDKFKGEGSRAMAYAKAMKGIAALNASVLDVAEKAGILDPEARKIFSREFYVPFFRERDEELKVNPSNVSGMVNQYATKRLKGGEDKLHDLMANMMQNWSHLLSASMKNNAAKVSLAKAEELGIAHRVKSDEKGSVFVKENGKDQHWVIDDPLVAQALESLSAVPFRGPVMKALTKFKYALTHGVTLSPTFRINNVIRDQIAATAANPTSYNFVQNMINGFRYSSKNNPEYANMLAGGAFIKMGQDYGDDRGRFVKRLINEGIDAKSVLDSDNKVKAALAHMWDWWQETGERSESLTRAELYRQVYKKLVDKGTDPELAHLEASYVAKDSMDFSLHGTAASIRMLTQVVPFLNARMQGLYKLGRGAGADPRRFAAVIGGVTLATIALTLAYRHDKEMNGRSEWDRDNFWAFRIGNKMLRIPKPFEIGALATVVDRGLEAAMDGLTPDARERFATRLLSIVGNQLNANPVPQAVAPLIQLWGNQSWFTNANIETEREQHLPKAERYSPRTSATAVGLGRAMSAVLPDALTMSPEQIDFLVNAYLGWAGNHAVATADLALRPLVGLPKKPAPTVNDYFLIGDFVKQLPSNQSRFVDQYYDHMAEVQQAFGEMRMLQQTGQTQELIKYLKTHPDAAQLEHIYINTQRQIGKLNQRVRYINMSNMSPEEKRDELNKIAQIKIRLAEVAEAARSRSKARQ